MKPTQTGIAVALALTVVVMFFILPGFSLFGVSAPSNEATPEVTTNDAQTAPTTIMPTDIPPVTKGADAGSTQLIMKDEIIGTGATATAGDSVTVHYIGTLTNGTVFDASRNRGSDGFTFNLGAGQVIKGWDEGIVGMKEGGKRKLFIPASLAYGSQTVGNVIPANSALIFEVELLKVQKAAR